MGCAWKIWLINSIDSSVLVLAISSKKKQAPYLKTFFSTFLGGGAPGPKLGKGKWHPLRCGAVR
jgi:hypothetical protein